MILVKVYEQTDIPPMLLIGTQENIRLEIIGDVNKVKREYRMRNSAEVEMVFAYVEKFANDKVNIMSYMTRAALSLNGKIVK